MDKTSKAMVNALRDAVRVRGMRGFLTHETVAREVFCLAFSSGVQNLEAWNSQLTNLHKMMLSFLVVSLKQDTHSRFLV